MGSTEVARGGVGNTGYVRFMYQMICPVLERLQAMEGGDGSDGEGEAGELAALVGVEDLRRAMRGQGLVERVCTEARVQRVR